MERCLPITINHCMYLFNWLQLTRCYLGPMYMHSKSNWQHTILSLTIEAISLSRSSHCYLQARWYHWNRIRCRLWKCNTTRCWIRQQRQLLRIKMGINLLSRCLPNHLSLISLILMLWWIIGSLQRCLCFTIISCYDHDRCARRILHHPVNNLGIIIHWLFCLSQICFAGLFYLLFVSIWFYHISFYYLFYCEKNGRSDLVLVRFILISISK